MRCSAVFPMVCTLLLTLSVASSAPADTALFRVEQRWHDSPRPAVTTPGGAGMYQGYIFPYYRDTPAGRYLDPPATAIVEPGNPVGGAFTLPQSFISTNFTIPRPNSVTPGIPGYTTYIYVSYYNGPGKFGPNHGATGPTRIVFPTTMGNPYPTYNGTLMKWTGGNYGLGNPVTPTATFSGRYDVSRGGSINVTPGPRRFGGTFRLFYGPNAGWYQYIYYFSPALYKRYGYYFCLDDGMFDCTPNTHVSEVGTTAIYAANWFLLTENGKAKATTATSPNGKTPTPYGNASYLTRHHPYLNQIHPWTTGFAKVHNPIGSGRRTFNPEPITPQAQGYDISLGGVTLSVKKYNYNQDFNKTLSTITTNTTTRYTQVLKGVTRVVSMVRPRLVHSYDVPLDPVAVPISNAWQAARLWRLKVYFLPEPGGMLMLGTGLGLLVVLHRASRRG